MQLQFTRAWYLLRSINGISLNLSFNVVENRKGMSPREELATEHKQKMSERFERPFEKFFFVHCFLRLKNADVSSCY